LKRAKAANETRTSARGEASPDAEFVLGGGEVELADEEEVVEPVLEAVLLVEEV